MAAFMNDKLKQDLTEYQYQDVLNEVTSTRASWSDRRTWTEFHAWCETNLQKKDDFARLSARFRGAYPNLSEMDLMEQFMEHLDIIRPRFEQITAAEDGWWIGYDALEQTWKRAHSQGIRPSVSGEDVQWLPT